MEFFKLWLITILSISIVQFSIIQANEQHTQEDMMSIIQNALEGFGEFYAILTSSEQKALTQIFDDLIKLGGWMQEYCDTGLKHNSLMLKYKLYKNLDQLCLNAAFGCTAKNDDPIVCRNPMHLNFDCESYLQQSELSMFYETLNPEEQEELRNVIMDMFNFCKKTIYDLEALLDRYPEIKSKLQTYLAQADQEMLVIIGFDQPFPSIIYKIA